MEYSRVLEKELLKSYSSYYNKCKINSVKNVVIKDEYLTACHIFLKIIKYYEEAKKQNLLDRISINKEEYENAVLNVKKYLQASKTDYYE